MVVLKKIKAATLIETLVATVLIVLVFMISTFLLNSLFNSTVRQNTDALKTHISELQYLSIHNQIRIPYDYEFEKWYISIERSGEMLIFEATHKETNKIVRMEHYE
jgi:competence protein ComGF